MSFISVALYGLNFVSLGSNLASKAKFRMLELAWSKSLPFYGLLFWNSRLVWTKSCCSTWF